ncbi:alcohol dehydrogenase catalytic domain-containing protein [Lactobacillus sp. CC-MHH1034]|uniref:alcohol dehydrogenase catalytic domain-containing protein n=1 Tax=Agrilactobacillus fermenti TaxID=2586909 RepID=UPI001E3F717D|nr:alcohol dehydrogenase catalytic domain-containing protein [Agrilactobacillus fermenti]MCD2256019.1 alcohol dehydrogenase catalytic domain-containing protein [Agrilactobacillus fermenti]
MRAAFIEQLGGPEVIRVGEQAIPKPRANEVLVQVQAAAVDNVDTYVRSGAFQTKLIFPFVIGRDAVGTVTEVGSDVTNFQPGMLVWTNSMGYDGRNGTTAEYITVPVKRLFKVPTGVDPIQLVAAVHAGATAAILLQNILQIKKGQQLLVEGGAGHVGRKLVALGNVLGALVQTTSATSDFDYLKKIGSHRTYDYHLAITESTVKQFDAIVDTSGKVDLQDNLAALNLNGQVALIAAPADDQFQFDVRQFYMNMKQIKGFVISHATVAQLQQAASLLNEQFAQGKLLDDQVKLLPLDQAAQAHQLVASGQAKRQKIVLKIH